MNENLATIQRVKNVRNHPNAEKLDLVNVLGWQVVVVRDQFKEDDLVVYVAIDNVLPEKPEFEFLRNKKFRIKPIRLRHEESAGICFPLSILPAKNDNSSYNEGDDVTQTIGVTHYEKPISPELAGQAIGQFPGFLKITDEDNLRTYPTAIPEMYGRPYYISIKKDGSSGTYFQYNGEFGVCSRRIHLMDTPENGFWKMAQKYNIQEALKNAFGDAGICIQGECAGPGIQKNPMGLKEMQFYLFNIFDISSRTYLDYNKLIEFSKKYNIPMVDIVETGYAFGYTLQDLIALSNQQKYPNDAFAEGIVIRPQESFYSPVLKKYWSGKVISENYKE